MIIVTYKSKRELKKHIGKPLKYEDGLNSAAMIVQNDDPFFATNFDGTFKATITVHDGIIMEVR